MNSADSKPDFTVGDYVWHNGTKRMVASLYRSNGWCANLEGYDTGVGCELLSRVEPTVHEIAQQLADRFRGGVAHVVTRDGLWTLTGPGVKS